MQDVKQMVTDFAAKMGLDGLVFGENDIAGIQFDNLPLNIHADQEAGELTLFLRLGDVPADPEERLAAYGFLLKTNNFARETEGCVLGVDDSEEGVYMSHRFAAGTLGVERLERIVEAFLNLAESLAAALSAARPETEKGGGFPANGMRRA